MKMRKLFAAVAALSALAFVYVGCSNSSSDDGGGGVNSSSTLPEPVGENIFKGKTFVDGGISGGVKYIDYRYIFTDSTLQEVDEEDGDGWLYTYSYNSTTNRLYRKRDKYIDADGKNWTIAQLVQSYVNEGLPQAAANIMRERYGAVEEFSWELSSDSAYTFTSIFGGSLANMGAHGAEFWDNTYSDGNRVITPDFFHFTARPSGSKIGVNGYLTSDDGHNLRYALEDAYNDTLVQVGYLSATYQINGEGNAATCAFTVTETPDGFDTAYPGLIEKDHTYMLAYDPDDWKIIEESLLVEN